jgi:hypothetical protein
MEPCRRIAKRLAVEGYLEITQKGVAVDPTGGWKGPIRLRLKQPPPLAPSETKTETGDS